MYFESIFEALLEHVGSKKVYNYCVWEEALVEHVWEFQAV